MGSEFWAHLVAMRNAAVSEGTISETDRALYTRTNDIDEAMRVLAEYRT